MLPHCLTASIHCLHPLPPPIASTHRPNCPPSAGGAAESLVAEPHTYDTIVGRRKGFAQVRACCCLAIKLKTQPLSSASAQFRVGEARALSTPCCRRPAPAFPASLMPLSTTTYHLPPGRSVFAPALVLRLLAYVYASRPWQVALETGASIVPCLAFGETNTFNTHVPPEVSPHMKKREGS